MTQRYKDTEYDGMVPVSNGDWVRWEDVISIEAEVARLREHIVNLLNIIDHGIPEPSHEGSCGPWVQCDGNCESAAYCAEYIHKAREALATKGEMK